MSRDPISLAQADLLAEQHRHDAGAFPDGVPTKKIIRDDLTKTTREAMESAEIPAASSLQLAREDGTFNEFIRSRTPAPERIIARMNRAGKITYCNGETGEPLADQAGARRRYAGRNV